MFSPKYNFYFLKVYFRNKGTKGETVPHTYGIDVITVETKAVKPPEAVIVWGASLLNGLRLCVEKTARTLNPAESVKHQNWQD